MTVTLKSCSTGLTSDIRGTVHDFAPNRLALDVHTARVVIRTYRALRRRGVDRDAARTALWHVAFIATLPTARGDFIRGEYEGQVPA